MKQALHRGLALTIVLTALSPAWAADDTTDKTKDQTLFTADAYIAHVKYLSSDELTGRAPGTEGSEKAAQYIVDRFKEAGCEPAGEDGGWFQEFEVRQGKRIVDEQASIAISGLDRAWTVRQDWIPFPFTEMEDVEGPLAFAGYGIQAPNLEFNDYDGFDAEGKILMIFRYEPKADDPGAEFGGEMPSRHALFVRKARIASKHGAKALLIVDPPDRDPDTDELYEFNAFNSQQTYQLPMVHITREMATAILEAAGAPGLKELQEKLDSERKPVSQDLGLTVTLHPGVVPNKIPAKSVLGMIRGNGSTDETIVIGAHRDHLGKVRRQFRSDDPTPVIHNGADDNASGTAGVIELARVLGAGPPLRRNLLFIAFDAEEMGLVGSKHFVDEPTIPLESIKAMVNLDMIGRLKLEKYAVFGTNSAAEFPDLVSKYAELAGLRYKTPGGMFGGSDHASFLRHQIPALFAFTGVHKEYHQPEDDWELIDSAGAVKVLEMWYPIIVDLANMDAGPTYTEPQEAEEEEGFELPRPAAEEQQEAADTATDSDEPPSREGMRVRLSVIPDMVGDDEPGMLVDSVLDNGAAKAGGILDGDRIIKIGDEEIRDIYAYMRAMQQFKPGDETEIVVIRNGEKKTLKVKLQASTYRKGKD